ncbi:MAG: hypothetical protein IJS34_02435 [Alphaproteobacteria bacterium]|nr:hypothetical protein [Alphaproteobacteria bacterium]
MNLINEFWKKIKTPIFWTIGYTLVLWLIYHTLFNFDIFNGAHWARAAHARFHGLGGFTFVILTLSIIPLYISSMFFIFRNKKAFFTIPVPQFITKLFTKPAAADATPENNEPEPESTLIDETPEVPDHFPTEMRGAFIHARTHPNRINVPICNVCSVTPNIYPGNSTTPVQPELSNEMPLPPDFDDDFDNNPPFEPSMPSTAPVFQDINFYDDDDINTNENIDQNVTEHLNKTNREFNIIDNDLILTNDMVIATHNDPEFWIMDEPTWFAAGKTRTSPIDELLSAAEQHNVKPVLVLLKQNIMNFDSKCAEWESKGITVITDLSTL